MRGDNPGITSLAYIPLTFEKIIVGKLIKE